MPRATKYFDKMLARFPEGTFDRIAAVLGKTEDRAEFIRTGVEREIKRRERGAADPLTKHLAPPSPRGPAVRGGRAA
jgi:hypothetical protein